MPPACWPTTGRHAGQPVVAGSSANVQNLPGLSLIHVPCPPFCRRHPFGGFALRHTHIPITPSQPVSQAKRPSTATLPPKIASPRLIRGLLATFRSQWILPRCRRRSHLATECANFTGREVYHSLVGAQCHRSSGDFTKGYCAEPYDRGLWEENR